MKNYLVIILAVVFFWAEPVCVVADGMTDKVVELKSQPKKWKARTSIREPRKVSPQREEPVVPSVIAAALPPARIYSDVTHSWQPYSYP
jgi:hypothetical protein